MSSVRVAGPAGALALADVGRGRLPVVFVHSLAGSSAHWSAQLEYLRPTRRAIALDLRGHGRSEPPRNGDFTLTSMAGDIEAVVDSLGIQRFVLVGHSLGGGVALAYAGTHPDRVAGLLLLDPIGDGTQIPEVEIGAFMEKLESNYRASIEGYWSQIAGPDSSIRERLQIDLRGTPPETVVPAFREAMQFNPHPALGRYRGPIMAVVTPNNDQAFSLHRLGKGFPHQVVQGTGHWIQLDKPDVVNEILDEFLETIDVNSKQ